MKALWHALVGMGILLTVLVAFSRIAKMPQSPQLIKNGADALAKLFTGAFGL